MTKRPYFALLSIGVALSATGCDSCKSESGTTVGDAATAIDAGPTQPELTLDVSNPSPHEWTVNVDRFPAVSDDGKTVALFVQKEDGTRHYPNAAVEVRTVADDKIVASVSILEAEALVAAEDAPDAFHTTLPAYKKTAQAKADDAKALLAKTKWTALHGKISNPPHGDAGAPPVLDGGFLIALRGTDKLSLQMARATDKDFASPLLNVDATAFQVPMRPPPTPQKGSPSCVFTPFVAETAVDGLHRVVLIRIAQAVKDNVWGCGEPSQWHVYSYTQG